MKELSLYVLDIFNNSLSANSSLIRIIVNIQKDTLSIKITDNGCGMDKAFLNSVKDPFSTTRTNRKVGMGLALFSQLVEMCDGHFEINSKKDVGTCVKASFPISHIDSPPMGDMTESLSVMVASLSKESNLIYIHKINDKLFCFDTRQIRETLGDEIPLNEPAVFQWIKSYLNSEFEKLTGETV